MAARPVALFFTAGVTDLKFVAEDGTQLEVSRDLSRAKQAVDVNDLHSELAGLGAPRIALWPFDPLPDEVPVDERAHALVSFVGRPGIPLAERTAVGLDGNEHRLRRLPDGRLLLAAGKMMPAWEALQRYPGRVCAVVGFDTRRAGRAGEPAYATELIGAKLAQRLDPAFHRLVLFVEGAGARLEDATGNVSQEVVARIEEGVRACRDAVRDGEPPVPWLATTGGIALVRPVIRAAVELHFGPSRTVERREGGQTASFYLAAPDGLIARRHALELVDEGDFAGADAVARRFERIERDRAWVRPLEWAARYFDGRLDPVDHMPDFLRRLTDPGLPRCLHAAMRTEAALRAGRLPEAVIWTCAFKDAALLDAIERLPWVERLDSDLKRLWVRPGCRPPGALLPGSDGDRTACLKGSDASGYVYYTGWNLDDRWLGAIPRSACLRRLARGLGDSHEHNSPLNIRNSLAHSALSTERMRRVRGVFVERQLWGTRNEGSGFLDVPVIRQVFGLLGTPRPVDLYREMTAGLARLVSGRA